VKAILPSVVLIGLTFCTSAQILTHQPARLKSKIISYEGKMGSGTRGVAINFAPERISPGTGGSDKITSPGHESELKWTFIGRNGNKDVYRFTFARRTKRDSSSQTTTAKEIQFDGKQIVVFEDDLHCVVMESPNEEDLKSAQNH
jgi:hypothetical protein